MLGSLGGLGVDVLLLLLLLLLLLVPREMAWEFMGWR